ncbi:alpha/beta hydrolase [Clostridium sp. Marseille-Q7071]
MRVMELVVILLNFLILGRVLIFERGATRNNVILLGISVVVTALQLLIEGYRWQMIPVYLVLVILLLQIFIFPRKYTVSASKCARIFKGFLIGIYFIVAVGLPLIMPMFSFTKPTGPYELGTKTFHFIDYKRPENYTEDPNDHRELMVQIWYPAKAGSNEPLAPYIKNPRELAIGLSYPVFALDHLGQLKTNSHQGALISKEEKTWPLLIFSHGMNLYRNQNTFQVEELASHGYIVAAIDHTYDAAVTVFPDGRVAPVKTQLEDGVYLLDEHMPLWTEDAKFVLDKLEELNKDNSDNGFGRLIDMNRIGMLGHSYGGANTMHMLLEDHRVKAGINMDGGLFGKPVPEKGIGKPFMIMDAQESEDYMNAAKEQSSLNSDMYNNLWGELARRRQVAMIGGVYSLTIPNTDHMSYTDLNQFTSVFKTKGEDLKYVHHVVNDVSLSFFNKYIKGDGSVKLEKIAERYPEIKFVKH